MRAFVAVALISIVLSGCLTSAPAQPTVPSNQSAVTFRRDLNLTFASDAPVVGGTNVASDDARFISDGGVIAILGTWNPTTPAGAQLVWTVFNESAGQHSVLSTETASGSYNKTFQTSGVHTYSLEVKPASPGVAAEQKVHVEITGRVRPAT